MYIYAVGRKSRTSPLRLSPVPECANHENATICESRVCMYVCAYLSSLVLVTSLIPTARYIMWRFKRDIDKLGPLHARDPFDVIFNRKKHKDDSDMNGQNGVELVSNHTYNYDEGAAPVDWDNHADRRLMRSQSYHGTELRGVPEHDDEGGDGGGGERAQVRGSEGGVRRKDSGKEGSQMHSSALRSGALRAYSRPGGHMASHLRV